MNVKINREKDVDIWFTSDLHFDHSNLCRGTTLWDADKMATAARPYDTLQEMNDGIIGNLNSRVKENDVLFILGDMYFGSFRFAECVEANVDYLSRINGRKYMILGNHDEYDIIMKVAENESCKIQAVSHYMELRTCAKVEKQLRKINIIAMHYPIAEWKNKRCGYIMCHAHSHHSFDYKKAGLNDCKIMDVGIDNENYMPYSIEDIYKEMNENEIISLDHH